MNPGGQSGTPFPARYPESNPAMLRYAAPLSLLLSPVIHA
jgi:hypothetical protein